ncbi:EAL domain-containing protein [Alteribacillus sp. YIM 98480]|uniref:EAL domain-containing protein n=1 Tax=Alteribacillus sp. YIM 98480 TaxID=2606599 RepID=UPI00131AB092|nr:EAL-associated domain-containing protein [Alteribacillus sp. YIM 98480]
MDVLDIVMNKDRVFPYYQPIISADKQEIIGYEVLGRYEKEDGEVIGLGSFFHDPNIPEEYRLEINEHIQHQALMTYLNENRTDFLFLSIDANIIVSDGGEHFFENLTNYKEQGLSFENIVLEIKEHEFAGEVSHLKHFIQYVQSMQIKVALDDVGKNTRNLDAIAFLEPNIIKVDLEFMEDHSFPSIFSDVLHSLSMLSRKIGASLLFKRIREFSQLNYAWRHGARYYQGVYLGKPKSQFLDKMSFAKTLRKDFHHFLQFEKKKIQAQLDLMNTLNQRLQEQLKDNKALDDIDKLTQNIASALEDITFRVYICNQEGFQQSGNAVKDEEGNWQYRAEERNRNWSWRPYFLENIIRMNYENRGILSDLYTDIHREERIRTYSFPVNEELYVFLDIPYSYLYEKDFLL